MNRRDFLTGSLSTGITLAGASLLSPKAEAASAAAKPLSRFAFITDTHVRPTDNAVKWIEVALKKVAAAKPDFVVHGGDLLDIAERQSIAECRETFAIWKKLATESGLKFHHTLGNHDLAAMVGDKRDENHPSFGKGFFCKEMAMSNSYYAVDYPKLKLIVLDTVEVKNDGAWRGYVDEAQIEWLKKELAATDPKKPIVVSGHIPIFSLTPEYDAGSDKPISPGMIVVNGKQVFEVMKDHNVVAVFQGHTHSIEDLRYIKTKYITGGAICGNWWKGNRFGVHEPGFALVEVFADRAEWTYQTYGWQA